MSIILFTWLIQTAFASTIILLCGSIALAFYRQPADGVRIIQWTLTATLAVLVLACWPVTPLISLDLVGAQSVAKTTETAPQPASSDQLARVMLAPEESLAPTKSGDHSPSTAPPPQANKSATTPRGWTVSVMNIVGFVYLVGCTVMLLWWAAGLVKLQRLLRRARPVSPTVQREFAQLANSSAGNVRFLVTDELAAPIMWGLRGPVIVLPTACCADANPQRLRYCLAHEWAHIVRHDFATWQLATVMQVFLYYHPLFWRVRRLLALKMDQLADAAAARQAHSATDYADYLVELARGRVAALPATSLGMSDKGSQLRQRVAMLIDSGLKLDEHCPPQRSLAIAAMALLIAGATAVVRVDADQPETSEQPSAAATNSEVLTTAEPSSADPTGAPVKHANGSLTYSGVVVDKDTGRPISDVKVSIIRRNSRENWRIYETTDHLTDSAGRYSFTISPEQAAESALYLEAEAHHPDYAAKSRSGYSHAMILRNLEVGEPPFFTRIELRSGKPITATVVSPEGKSLPGVKVRIYSATSLSQVIFTRGSWDETATDERGQFRIVPATPGDGVLWIIPDEYSPVAYRLRDHRGDWGVLAMEPGATVTGRVLTVDGEPVSGVKIDATRRGDGYQADEFLNANAVANGIRRQTITDNNGSFTLAPLPDGEYELQVQAVSEGYNPSPLEHVFLRQSMTITDGVGPNSLEIRAVPHVEIRATYLDSKGKPRSGHELTLWGRWDGAFYAEQSSVPQADGKLFVRAPRGLQEANLDLMTNEHSALRWRMAPGEPLRRGRRVDLGTLENDVSGIEIVRYAAPMLLIKPVDEAGNIVRDCRPVITYTNPVKEGEELENYTVGGNVSLEHQPDGRWRTSQLLPDEPFKVTVEKEGYQSKPYELSLPEGDEHELKIVLKQASAN
jgi:beta-lactamase regulating signal transducer with metallopeptidase domain/5-hydroxyisourate hydrolase-like protein (transthyretin family)